MSTASTAAEPAAGSHDSSANGNGNGKGSIDELIGRPGEAVKTLLALSSERAVAEAKVAVALKDRSEAAERAYMTARAAAESSRDADLAKVEADKNRKVSQIKAASQAERTEVDQLSEAAKKKAISRCNSESNSAKKAAEDARWQAQTLTDAARIEAKERASTAQRQLLGQEEALTQLKESANHTFEVLRKFAPAEPAPAEPTPPVEPTPETAAAEPAEENIDLVVQKIAEADASLTHLEGLKLPNFVALGRYIPLMTFFTAILAGGLGFGIGWIAGGVIGVVLGGVGAFFLRKALVAKAKTQVAQEYFPLQKSFVEIEALIARIRQKVLAEHAEKDAAALAKREQELQKIETKKTTILAEAQKRRDAAIAQAMEAHTTAVAEIDKKREEQLKAVLEKYTAAIATIKAASEEALAKADREYQQGRQTIQAVYERDWKAMADRWRAGIDHVKAEETDLNAIANHYSPCRDGSEWEPRSEIPPLLRVGEFRLDLKAIQGGIPKDPTLKPEAPEAVILPAMVPFPEMGCLMVKAPASARDQAAKVLQAAMLRLLMSVPPAKVRFTIFDPVGLGRNFAAFMHLVDFDEALVASRIWTEPAQLERKLTDMTEVMENVIQKYLRNEFETIREYNAQAGEVSEPYRVLVVSDFPHGVSEAAARRLASIVESGPRCGVSVLMSVDTGEPLPGSIKLADIERHSAVVTWQPRDNRFSWKGGPLEPFPLTVDDPPEPSRAIELLKEIGAAAKKANRVEVPFEVIAPQPENYWKGDSRAGIDVPLGRAGANRLQDLKLGKGTSQHVLIAGRTGSGKSTLLHALITNLALHYSPEEVHLYLIDFKKGVEFKTYAHHELPHARVIAVESEREFGVSVLQKLDDEMKVRGDLYRGAGAQDVASYRRNTGLPLPRLLLIIDEFQEFFVEDDKVGQEAALLLDRLVRQGRAFGIHLHMGSQTLAGAYSLARSTLGQMGIRIALQCSESDAHMILSEDNAAARLLSRPGEAIYNDANGMVEGNHIFQVVWLNDDRREKYLKMLHAMATERKLMPSTPAIVFEGDVAAEIGRNGLLLNLMDAESWPEASRAPRAWLGEAVAIKDPTAAVFRPQGGSNLLIVGQNDEAAVAMQMVAILSLASQFDPASAKFYIGDATPVDSPFVDVLFKIAPVLPQPVKTFGTRDLAKVLGEIVEEINRRQVPDAPAGIDTFLVIHDLSRFRELRKSDDDFGSYGRSDEPPSPSKLFGTILREGPAFGVHVIVWCDSLNNINRALERSDLREFEMRVLFQMSQGDSSSLIDTPVASKLGYHRAYYHSEEQGTMEKFRPYAVPTDEWLQDAAAKFKRRPWNPPAEPERPEPEAPRGAEPADSDGIADAPSPAPDWDEVASD